MQFCQLVSQKETRVEKPVSELKEAAKLKEETVELKVCERCGGLWLRPGGSRWIYCGPCKAKLEELPPPALRPTRATMTRNDGKRNDGKRNDDRRDDAKRNHGRKAS